MTKFFFAQNFWTEQQICVSFWTKVWPMDKLYFFTTEGFSFQN